MTAPDTEHDPDVRAYRVADEAAVAGVWHRAGRDAYPYLPAWQALDAAEARRVFRDVIAARCEVFVLEREGRIVAFLAMQDALVDRLYVDPTQQRRGLGARLLGFAKRRRPGGLSLFTHQQNHAARAFYEKHGFTIVRFGTSPPPELAPDVEYGWHPPSAAEVA